MDRKKSKDYYRVELWLTNEDRANLKLLAGLAKMSVSEYVEYVIRERMK